MRYDPVLPDTLVTLSQRRVILSSLALKGVGQVEFAAEVGVNRADLNRTINGKLVVTEKYGDVLNKLVREAHPVKLGKMAA